MSFLTEINVNLPDIQILNVEITEHEIKCDIESTRGYSVWRRCRQKATRYWGSLRWFPKNQKIPYRAR